MIAPFTISECGRCGYRAYPPRILCPTCAANDWKRRPAEHGVVTEVTVRRPVSEPGDQEGTRLACVQSDAGVRIVARIQEGVEVGDRVTLLSKASSAAAPDGQVVEAVPLGEAE